MKVFTFLCINFIVGFISDILLNDLSTNYNILSSLKPYFHNQSIVGSAVIAAITIEIALIATMALFYALFHSFVPTNYLALFYFCTIGFVVGYLMDIGIQKTKPFGNRLNNYYKEFGAGFWGAAAFLFSILISYFIQKELLPLL